MTGFEFLRSGAEVATAWGFDCTKDNPYNDFDGDYKDWNVVFPGVDKLTPTIYGELCREDVGDCRYVATLQQEIVQAGARGHTAAARGCFLESAFRGEFVSRGLKPGIYTLQAAVAPPQQPQITGRASFIIAHDPFAWEKSK